MSLTLIVLAPQGRLAVHAASSVEAAANLLPHGDSAKLQAAVTGAIARHEKDGVGAAASLHIQSD